MGVNHASSGVIYTGKSFITLTPGANLIKLFSAEFILLSYCLMRLTRVILIAAYIAKKVS
jgi:hypothetical protein